MTPGHTALGPGAEFDLIRELTEAWGDRARGIGDDAALLDVPHGERLVVSVDTSLEDVHFRRAWLTSREIGYRATAAALSDLAAMAAWPLGALVALTLPPAWRTEARALGEGIGDAAGSTQCPLVGGDVTSGDKLSLTLTVLGHARHPVRRAGARTGDVVYVTGRLGGPGAALEALRAGHEPHPEHRRRFAHPEPRLAAARWLAARGASAMIDISDGLSSELAHLAAASGVAIELDLERVPLCPGVTPEQAAASGEEYELLLTAAAALDTADFAGEFGIPLSPIGRITSERGPAVTARLHGQRVQLDRGYDQLAP